MLKKRFVRRPSWNAGLEFNRRDRGGGEGTTSNLQAEALNLANGNAPSMKDISGILRISPPAATALVRNLLRAGSVERVLDQKDRRVIRLKLTARGRQTLEKNRKDRAARWEEISRRLDGNDGKELLRILRKLTAGN